MRVATFLLACPELPYHASFSGRHSRLLLGRNKIEALESFLPLRKLTQLRALMADGNPCADRLPEDYEAYVLAYLGTAVKWLDYRVVDAEKAAACREQFQNELEALASSEGIKKAEAVQAAKDKVFRAELQKIYMLEAATLCVSFLPCFLLAPRSRHTLAGPGLMFLSKKTSTCPGLRAWRDSRTSRTRSRQTSTRLLRPFGLK